VLFTAYSDLGGAGSPNRMNYYMNDSGSSGDWDISKYLTVIP